jgi:hypothetical protein
LDSQAEDILFLLLEPNNFQVPLNGAAPGSRQTIYRGAATATEVFSLVIKMVL